MWNADGQFSFREQHRFPRPHDSFHSFYSNIIAGLESFMEADYTQNFQLSFEKHTTTFN